MTRPTRASMAPSAASRWPAAVLLLAALVAPACAGVRGDGRLLEDCGGFVPSAELIEAAAALGDPLRGGAAAAALEAAPPAPRLDVLRAGLRLRNPAAARAAAERLEWEFIDRWECARCVDLLVDDVLRPGSGADFEKFRSYIGSVELPRFLRALPPLPWKEEPGRAIGQMHRIARAQHLPLYIELARHPDPAVSEAAYYDIGLLGLWNDDLREEVEAVYLEGGGFPFTGIPPADGEGLPPILAAGLRYGFLGEKETEDEPELPHWSRRWLWECTPGPRDAGLLMELAERGAMNWTTVAGSACVLLGRLSDPETEAFLRRMAEDGEELAAWALARRGDGAMLDRVVADARDGEDFALALLMEIDPPRAAALLRETLLGPDEEAAFLVLDDLAMFAVPGAYWEPLGFDWRRTDLSWLGEAAVEAGIPAVRLACIGAVVPGCRTRALGRAAALALRPGDLGHGTDLPFAPFLETAAPVEFTDALRRIRSAEGEDAPLASEWLVRMADREACAALVAGGEIPWESYLDLARSGAPEAREWFEERVWAALEGGEFGSEDAAAVGALAVFHGLPESAEEAFEGLTDPPLPRGSVEAVLAGRPLDGLAALLEARPDEPHGDVALVPDPRVAAYLRRLRARRELGHYWYATAQLAVAGDPEARAEFQGAMHDGRYRIMNGADNFERTLGGDLPATMPFWLEELRSQCCRIVTSAGGDIFEELLGLEDGCYQSPYRTAFRRGRELWEAAGGRWVRSRIAGHRVPEPR